MYQKVYIKAIGCLTFHNSKSKAPQYIGVQVMHDYIIFKHIIYMKFKIYNFQMFHEIMHEG